MKNNMVFALASLLLVLISTACSKVETEAKYPTGYERTNTGGDIYAKPDSIFGKGGIFGERSKDGENGDTGIGVNSFLWRASLDTVSFMPLASADPFGGTILTDWYSAAETPDERYKVNVFILGKQLRSDGVRVRVFKQQQGKSGWKDIAVSDDTARKLEDAILTRARQLRMAQTGPIEE
ncbi:MAG: DUF3576 domain-containing protein [Alphaproteobacteria bacterium]